MPEVKLLESGIVYRGSEDHAHLRNAGWPSIARLADGRLVVTMTIGREKNSFDVRCYVVESADNGLTWSQPRKIFEPDESAHPVSAGIRMSQVHDGTLAGFVNLLDRSDPDAHEPTNPENGGTVDREHGVVRSRDGRVWSEPDFFDPPLDWKCFGEPSPILAVSADRWLLPSLTRLNWQGQCPLGLKSFVMISEDQGHTWPRATDVFDLWSEKIATWEQKHAKLEDGRILAVTWAFNDETKEDLPNHYTFSEDDGDSYGDPLQSPLFGQTCTPLALPENHILCVYRRLDKNGLWGHLARIENTDWKPLAEACLWGSDREALPGRKDSSVVHMHNLQFGFPQLVQLEDAIFFVVFWAVEEGLARIRWIRLSVDF